MQDKDVRNTMEKIVALAKRRGFVYPGSDIYGGLAGTYDYGPLGVLLKNNLTEAIRRTFTKRDNLYEIDAAILMNPKVWEASGHLSGFADPLAWCKKCQTKMRVDKALEKIGISANENMSEQELDILLKANVDKIKCSKCGSSDFTEVEKFNMMIKTNTGAFDAQDDEEAVYLRPETAQGIYVNYKNVLDSTPVKIPFGLFQIGKSFRNEISPRQFLFRMREFTQIEMQYFVHPDEAEKVYKEWKEERMKFYIEELGIPKEKLRFKQHENLIFYAKDAWDIEYKFSFGWDEIEGLHWRGDYDLSQHQKFSGQKLAYLNPQTGERYIPNIIEAASGLDRLLFILLDNAYTEDEMGEKGRVYLNMDKKLSPIKIAVSPLLKNKPELVSKAKEVFSELKEEFLQVMWDDNGNIGKRYRRQDEIGTPFCVVIDFETLDDNSVTVRHRNSGEQERIKISELKNFLK